MADLISGRYVETNPLMSALGLAANINQPNLPAYTNASFFGLVMADTAAAVTTAKANAVAVPVDIGAVIQKITVFVGGTVSATSTHSNFALYSGGVAAPAIIGTQSTDVTSGAGGTTANTMLQVTITPVMITAAMAPQGYIYVSYGLTATTVPSLAAFSTPTAIGYQWALVSATANPLGFGFTATGGGASAPATLASTANVASAYFVVLQ